PTPAAGSNPLLSAAEVQILAANEQFQAGIANYERSEFREALALWQAALDDFRSEAVRAAFPQDSLQGEANALGNLGIAYDSLGDYRQAIDFQRQSLEIAQQIGDRQGEASVLGNLGIAYAALGDYRQAIDFHQQSLEIAQQIGDRQGEADSLGNLGNAYHALGDYLKAIDLHQQSLEIAQQIGDRRGEANALGNLGIAYDALGDYGQAIDFHQQSLEIAQQIGYRLGEASVLGNLGTAYDSLGDYRQAIDFYQQAREIAQQIGDRRGEANSLGSLGSAYHALGDYLKAIDFHQQQLDIARQIGDRQGEANSLGSLGNAYHALGDYQKAIDFYQQAREIARQIGDRRGEAASLTNLGSAYRSLGDYHQAIDFLQQAREIAQQIGYRLGEASVLGNLGSVYAALGDYQKAIDFYQQYLGIARQIGDRRGEAASLTNLGSVYAALGDYRQAIDFHQQAREIAQQIGDRLGEAIALHNLGIAYRDLEDLAAAERYLQASAQVQESLHTDDLPDANRLSLLDSQQRTYRVWQLTLIEQGQPEAALEVAERGRAQALAASMSRFLEEIPSPPDLNRIQAVAAAQNATLVEYSVLPSGRILIWVIQPNGTLYSAESDAAALDESLIEAANVFAGLGQNGRGGEPPETPLSNLVQDTQAALTVRGGEDGAAVAPLDRKQLDRNLQELHALLIEPIAQWLPEDERQQVIFIPHQELFRVPFAALQDDDGIYLIEQHTILTASSIQSLELARQHRERIQTADATDALIVGNPTLPETLVAAYGWQALPGAEREAVKVGSYLSDYLGTALTVLLREQATERRVRERLHTARFIHLATHGTLASEPTDLPGLQYSFVPGVLALAESEEENGELTANEILEMTRENPLNAELVVLSACQTGQGPITSDGVYGLSRVLLTAGVPTLVVSLWDASDYHTDLLMDEFYRQFLEEGQDKAQALRQAMLQMINEKDNNPQYWAAFTLMGIAE
ncbi:MAG: CHAT domain-containing protein, partial [Leptolyngbya sp. SIO4C5]|nr:CHAT domain-containing protein [Leptolyngbya sp. SIO4C5]